MWIDCFRGENIVGACVGMIWYYLILLLIFLHVLVLDVSLVVGIFMIMWVMMV